MRAWQIGRVNYRHAYHAGGFADVLKHAILALVIAHLRKKETPFCVLDTHAGAGRYDLAADEPTRTGEWRAGVGRLVDARESEELAGYLAALRAANPAWPRLRVYPGSPAIARHLLRPQDRLIAVELHPEDSRLLRRAMAGDRRVAVHAGDGYEALKAHLPPKERRGLVLIDPPFEDRHEFQRLGRGLAEAVRRWPGGIFLVWYPIKASGPVERFRAEIAGLGRPALAAEMLIHPLDDPERLNGAGIAILHPPWKLDTALDALLPLLAARLEAKGGAQLLRLAGEAVV